jgi:hypothetical protein
MGSTTCISTRMRKDDSELDQRILTLKCCKIGRLKRQTRGLRREKTRCCRDPNPLPSSATSSFLKQPWRRWGGFQEQEQEEGIENITGFSRYVTTRWTQLGSPTHHHRFTQAERRA